MRGRAWLSRGQQVGSNAPEQYACVIECYPNPSQLTRLCNWGATATESYWETAQGRLGFLSCVCSSPSACEESSCVLACDVQRLLNEGPQSSQEPVCDQQSQVQT